MRGADVFFDSNVALYLLSADAAKASRAEELLAGGGTVSVQVLNEVASVARRRLALSWSEIGEITGALRAVCEVRPLTEETHERGLRLAAGLHLSLYDAMIVAAALLAGCRTLYSEDLQHGRVVERTLTIRNPFAAG
jgi:predicted nucleic acid-binding protein